MPYFWQATGPNWVRCLGASRLPKIGQTNKLYNMTTDYKMNKRCVVLKAKKMQSACFFFYSLVSIELKKQSEYCMKDIQTHGTRFCAWYYGVCFCSHVGLPKSNLHYTRGITPKRVTSGGAHFRCLAPGQHSSEEISQRWRAVGDPVPI